MSREVKTLRYVTLARLLRDSCFEKMKEKVSTREYSEENESDEEKTDSVDEPPLLSKNTTHHQNRSIESYQETRSAKQRVHTIAFERTNHFWRWGWSQGSFTDTQKTITIGGLLRYAHNIHFRRKINHAFSVGTNFKCANRHLVKWNICETRAKVSEIDNKFIFQVLQRQIAGHW